jgi:hypothetical protein
MTSEVAEADHGDREATGSRSDYGGRGPLGVAICVIVAAGLTWTVRRMHIGNLDALALAEKVAIPQPQSALDWPELQVRAVIAQPGMPEHVLLQVGWPAHPERESTLLLAVSGDGARTLDLLGDWCAIRASVAPVRRGPTELELRRRQTLERVRGVLIAEDGGGKGLGQRCMS